ncbi:hypothetical protein MHYP_G00201940 [Metynnis hypsauchen]
MEVKPEDNEAVLCCESVNQVSRSPLSITRSLTVLFEPAEVTLLGSVEAIDGMEVILCCHTSSSNPPVHIRWWLGFRELNNATVTISENGKVVQVPSKHVQSERGVSREFLLTLHPSDNLATYRCDATNEAKKVRSAEIKLQVQFPAVNVKIVVKQNELRAGQTLYLDCLAGSSNPKANVSWSLGSTRLKGVDQAPKKAEYGGLSISSKLALRLGSHHHGNRITCQAFSGLLSEGVNTFYNPQHSLHANNQAFLTTIRPKLDTSAIYSELINMYVCFSMTELVPPEFAEDQPTEVEIIEDDMATLPVMVSANPDDVTCEWVFQGDKVVKERDHRYHFPEGWALEIWNVSRRDAGNYRVECSNAEGKNSTSIKLDVQYAPSVKMKKDPVFVNVGDTADLMCEADANPINPGMFSWKWMGEGEVKELGEESEDGATGMLTLYEVTRAQAGPYQCTADNDIAPPASVVGQLIVRFAPELQKGAQWKKVASRGDGTTDVDILCQAEGVPRVTFNWAKNSVPLDFNNPRYIERTVREGAIHTSTLTVVNVSAALDYAVFTCTARNSQGEDTLDIQLLSTSYPDPPSDLKLLSVSSSSVTLEWMPGFDGGLIQNFRVRYRWAESASYLYVDVFPPRATVYTVTGLKPSTTYNFSVNAINSMGDSSYADKGVVLTVTTLDREPAPDEPELEVPDSSKASAVPVYAIAILVGGLLLLLNALGFVLFARRRRGRSLKEGASSALEGKKSESEGSSVSSSSRYASRERINTSAQRTLLIDTSSEPDSSGSVYESYGGESYHYYYPTEAYSPALYPHPEAPEEQGIRLGLNPLSHEYEEVRDWRPYEDLLAPTLPPVTVQGFGVDRLGRTPLPAYQEAGRRGEADLDPTSAVYNSLAYRRKKDSDLPFELRGELV